MGDKRQETQPLHFEGYSDDTFGEHNRTRIDHDNCASCEPIVFEVTDAAGEGLLVVGQYAVSETSGVWTIGVAPRSEDVPLPSWPMRFEASERPYSPRLVIEAPAGVRVELLGEDEG